MKQPKTIPQKVYLMKSLLGLTSAPPKTQLKPRASKKASMPVNPSPGVTSLPTLSAGMPLPPPQAVIIDGQLKKEGDIVEVVGGYPDYHNIPLGTRVKILGIRPDSTLVVTPDPEDYNNGVLIQRYVAGWTQVVNPNQLRALPTVKPRPKIDLETVVLAKEKKEQIMAAISQIKHTKKIFSEWGFEEVFEKGTAVSLIFFGIPGTGKTLMAQAIADHLDMTLKKVGTAEFQSSEPGGTERNIQAIFGEIKMKAARDDKKTVLLFDECDSLLTDRNEVGPILGAQINCLLQEIENHTGVIIFTTNRLGKLDPALERRISAKIEFPFPQEEERELIWIRNIPAKAPLGEDVDPKILATYKLAGGSIKNAVLTAARMAAYEESEKITLTHFKLAVKQELIGRKQFSEEYDAQPHQQQVHSIARTSSAVEITEGMEGV